jgi:hypothetical protein
MKNRKSFLFLWLTMAVAIACNKDETPDPSKQRTGRLSIEIGLFIHVNETDNPLKSTEAAEDFRVTIYSLNGTEILSFARASEMPAQIELEAGDYYVTAHSDNNLPAAFENPYYFGRSEDFNLSVSEEESVVVNCELANSMVTVVYSENVKTGFDDYYTIVKSGSDSLIFSQNETRAGYFQPGRLSIKSTLIVNNGGTVIIRELTGLIDQAQARRHYEIRVDALPDKGNAAIQIALDESVETTEIVTLQENNIPLPGVIPSGGLIITEIMANPSALADNEGEWMEIYNALTYPVNLHHLVIRRDAANSHIISESISLNPGQYFVLARTDNAFTGNKYVYGSAITLTNTSAQLSLSNYGTDGTDGSLIFAVTYGGSGFSVPDGASLSLNPLHLNAADAASGGWWCAATAAYNTGDLGTPGGINNPCN